MSIFKNDIEKKIWANGGPMEAISKTFKGYERLRKELQFMHDYYLSASNKFCAITSMYRIEWFFDLCEEIELQPRCINSLHYTADSEFFNIDWVEHDLIIAFKQTEKIYHDMNLQTGCNVEYRVLGA